MKVYITDLSAYNQGHLVGEFFTLPLDEFQLKNAISLVLKRGTKICNDVTKHDEVFITDSEGFPMKVNEYDDLFKLNEIAEKFSNLDNHEKKIVEFLMGDNIVTNIDEAIDNIENVSIYEGMTMEDIAEQYIEDCVDLSNIPDIIKNHIDYEGIARDMYIDGNYYKVDGDIYEVHI